MIKRTLYFRNETNNKLRWDDLVKEDGATFEFYIPKWRVPKPWPARIIVSIDSYIGDMSDFTQSPYDSDKSIEVLVEHIEPHTKTVKYAQVGYEKYWQIGQPYIPESILTSKFPSIPKYLIIEVNWDLEGGKFEDSPIYRGKTYK